MTYLTETEVLQFFDIRQAKAISACVEYNDDPYGDVAHNLKVIVAKLYELASSDPEVMRERLQERPEIGQDRPQE